MLRPSIGTVVPCAGASQEGHEAIVQILLAKGAEVNVRENGGGTALKYAETQKIKKLLKASGALE